MYYWDMLKEDSPCLDYLKNAEIMQYTGQCDKNRKDIYEGDVIECEYYPDLPTTKNKDLVWRGVVKYSDNSTSFFVIRNTEHNSCYSVGYSGSAIKRWEVIGNIYESPSLLGATP